MEFLQPDSEAEPKNQVLFNVSHRCEIDTALTISICTLTCFLENTTNKQKLRGVFIFTYSPGTRTYELESFIKGCFPSPYIALLLDQFSQLFHPLFLPWDNFEISLSFVCLSYLFFSLLTATTFVSDQFQCLSPSWSASAPKSYQGDRTISLPLTQFSSPLISERQSCCESPSVLRTPQSKVILQHRSAERVQRLQGG